MGARVPGGGICVTDLLFWRPALTRPMHTMPRETEASGFRLQEQGKGGTGRTPVACFGTPLSKLMLGPCSQLSYTIIAILEFLLTLDVWRAPCVLPEA